MARRRRNTSLVSVGTGLGGLAAGAALVYWLDPQRGARRRAEVRQRSLHAAKEVAGAASVTAHDMAHRARGQLAEMRGRIEDTRARMRGEVEDDAVVVERVRAKLGRLCSHPHAVEVSCRDGRVELKGPILKAELDQVLRGISKVRGVREIDDDLEPHETAGHVPGLQGGVARTSERPELLQEVWSPTAQLLAGSTGAALLGWGLARRTLWGVGAGAAGLTLLLRSLTNLPVRRIVGLGAGRRAIDLRKDLHVNAPVEEVFAFFSRFENFPRFMSHVREVAPHGERERRWRWSVTGPAGVPVSWDAELTRLIPNQVIAWRSVAGSVIRNAGIIRFDPDRGGTRIGIRLSYNPPGGAIGHALASALGADPKRQLDDDLIRFKSLIETGKATGREETVSKEELAPRPSPPTGPLH